MHPILRLGWQRILGCDADKAQWSLLAVTHSIN